MNNFKTLNIPQPLQDALGEMGFDKPTPVQAQAIPPALKGHDVLGTAQTGTGKTAAFGLPLLAHLINNPESVGLILCPTRELAAQVMDSLRDMMKYTQGIKSALLLGGNPMPVQLQMLKRRPRLIVGTPGRINDHLRRDRGILKEADFIVLDEADRMLDMGFTPQLDEILKFVPHKRQMLMFSATMDKKTTAFTGQYLNDPVRVAVAAKKITADNINHNVIHTTVAEKKDTLMDELNARHGSVLVFVKTRRGADRLANDLSKIGHEAKSIHGDLRQRQRDRVIRGFREKQYRIMVATDVAARGLDIPHIEHVINYDLPQSPEDYIHRIGRTARAGKEGSAICLVCPSDRNMWGAINRLMNPDAAGNDNKDFKKERSGNKGGFSKKKGNFNKANGAKKRPDFKKKSDDNQEGGFKKKSSFKKKGDSQDRSFKKRDGFKKTEKVARKDGDKPNTARPGKKKNRWSDSKKKKMKAMRKAA